jgi:hypothetical protein
MKKFWAKKVLKKMRGGSAIEREFTEDVKLAEGGMRETKGYEDDITKDIKLTHGGVAMQDVLKKENDPKKYKGGWIQGAVKKPGALRAVAAKEGLIKGDQKLSSSDLSKLGSQAKKSGNSLLAKRVSLAKTFAKMRK